MNDGSVDASNEAHLNWWDGNTNHVIHGTKGSIDNIKNIISELIRSLPANEWKPSSEDTLISLQMSCLFEDGRVKE